MSLRESLKVTQLILADTIKKKFGYSEPRLFSEQELTSELGNAEMVASAKAGDVKCILNAKEGGFLDSYHFKRVFAHDATTSTDKDNLFKYIISIQEQLGLSGKNTDDTPPLEDTEGEMDPEAVFNELSKNVTSLVAKAPKKAIHDLIKTVAFLHKWLQKQAEYRSIVNLGKKTNLASFKKPETIAVLVASLASNPHMKRLLQSKHGTKLNEMLQMLAKLGATSS